MFWQCVDFYGFLDGKELVFLRVDVDVKVKVQIWCMFRGLGCFVKGGYNSLFIYGSLGCGFDFCESVQVLGLKGSDINKFINFTKIQS